MSEARKKCTIKIRGADEANLGLDEITATGCDFHGERMTDTSFWFGVNQGGKYVNVWLTAKRGKIIASVEADGVFLHPKHSNV